MPNDTYRRDSQSSSKNIVISLVAILPHIVCFAGHVPVAQPSQQPILFPGWASNSFISSEIWQRLCRPYIKLKHTRSVTTW